MQSEDRNNDYADSVQWLRKLECPVLFWLMGGLKDAFRDVGVKMRYCLSFINAEVDSLCNAVRSYIYGEAESLERNLVRGKCSEQDRKGYQDKSIARQDLAG